MRDRNPIARELAHFARQQQRAAIARFADAESRPKRRARFPRRVDAVEKGLDLIVVPLDAVFDGRRFKVASALK